MQRVIRWSILGLLGALLLFTAITVFAPSLLGRFYLQTDDVFIFPGVQGPTGVTAVAAPPPADWREFSGGDPTRLAILLTDPDSAWLGLAQGLKTIGLPFVITDDPERAMRHRVVMVYPMLAGSVLGADALGALGGHVRRGGTVIGVNVLGGGLQEVFGFEEVRATREHTIVRFDPKHELAADFRLPEEQEIRIATLAQPDKAIGAHEYMRPRNLALATYGNGSAAITWRDVGDGHAYAMGFDPGLLLQKAHGYRLEGVARAYVNIFEPTADVILRLLKRIYRQGEPDAVTLYSVPMNRSLSVNVTHDIDYNESLENAVDYARLERELGVTGTYFIQTKYVRDWNDKVFFNEESIAHLRALTDLGMEIASHSVSHSKVFSKFPLGTGAERYPDYVPYVYEERKTYEGTVLGELRVSKFLLDHFSSNEPVVSFRAGHLENPFSLPEALQATGYQYDSTITANNVLSHLPYRLNHHRGGDSQVTVWEFPVTIEDERRPALPQRLDDALAVARNIGRYGGNFVLLIHPNVAGEKLEFLRTLIEELKPIAWFGSISEFGAWWQARDRLEVDVEATGNALRVRLRAPQPIAGLTLELPSGLSLGEPASRFVASLEGDRAVLNEFRGDIELVFERADP